MSLIQLNQEDQDEKVNQAMLREKLFALTEKLEIDKPRYFQFSREGFMRNSSKFIALSSRK